MSFVGITFAGQKVTPSADALLMQHIFDDGIFQGCELSAAGFTISMAAGNLMICGRHILHDTSEGWAMNGASSGYARLILTIDLSKTATVDAFDQIETTVEYAATADGFPALEQSEINISGVKYQAEICVVSLSSGGITGIVRQLQAVSLRSGADMLSQFFVNGYFCMSKDQVIASPDDVPEDAPDWSVFLYPMEG